jgi:hypothetical protein
MKNYYPYSGDQNTLTLNSEDSIYTEQSGESGLLNLVQLGSDYSAGFLGSITVGISGGSGDASDVVSSSSQSSASMQTIGSSTETVAVGSSTATGTTISSSVPVNTSLATKSAVSVFSVAAAIVSILAAASFTVWHMTL